MDLHELRGGLAPQLLQSAMLDEYLEHFGASLCGHLLHDSVEDFGVIDDVHRLARERW